MGRPSLITQYLNAELPSKSQQRRLYFRPDLEEVDALYRSLNRHLFDNLLTQPPIEVYSLKKCWGLCNWHTTRQRSASWGKAGTWCTIKLNDKWFSPQWFVTTLAHEMVHQWQWDIYRWQHLNYYGKPMFEGSGAHGPSFHYWRPAFAELGISLKIAHGKRRWFRHQDLFKC